MINWQRILWDLKRDYAHIAFIAREIGANRVMLQRRAQGKVKRDIEHHLGVKLLELHKRYCHESKNRKHEHQEF